MGPGHCVPFRPPEDLDLDLDPPLLQEFAHLQLLMHGAYAARTVGKQTHLHLLMQAADAARTVGKQTLCTRVVFSASVFGNGRHSIALVNHRGLHT